MNGYKIIIETTERKPSAEARLNFLKENKIDCYIHAHEYETGVLYSVQAGPFTEKKYALENVDKIKRLGLFNAFITR